MSCEPSAGCAGCRQLDNYLASVKFLGRHQQKLAGRATTDGQKERFRVAMCPSFCQVDVDVIAVVPVATNLPATDGRGDAPEGGDGDGGVAYK